MEVLGPSLRHKRTKNTVHIGGDSNYVKCKNNTSNIDIGSKLDAKIENTIKTKNEVIKMSKWVKAGILDRCGKWNYVEELGCCCAHVEFSFYPVDDKGTLWSSVYIKDGSSYRSTGVLNIAEKILNSLYTNILEGMKKSKFLILNYK